MPAGVAAALLTLKDADDVLAGALMYLRAAAAGNNTSSAVGVGADGEQAQPTAAAAVGGMAAWQPYIAALPSFVPAGVLLPQVASAPPAVAGMDLPARQAQSGWRSRYAEVLPVLVKAAAAAAAAEGGLDVDDASVALIAAACAGVPDADAAPVCALPSDSSVRQGAVHGATAKWVRAGVRGAAKSDLVTGCTWGSSSSACVPSLGDHALSLQSFVWAHTVVASRAMTLRGVRHLVPGADMFNHEPHPVGGAGAPSFEALHVVSGGSFEVRSDRQQVGDGGAAVEAYGDGRSATYALWHGFTPAVNDNDCVTLLMPAFQEATQPRRRRWATALELPASGTTLRECVKFMRQTESDTACATCGGDGVCAPALVRLPYPLLLWMAVAAVPDAVMEEYNCGGSGRGRGGKTNVAGCSDALAEALASHVALQSVWESHALPAMRSQQTAAALALDSRPAAHPFAAAAVATARAWLTAQVALVDAAAAVTPCAARPPLPTLAAAADAFPTVAAAGDSHGCRADDMLALNAWYAAAVERAVAGAPAGSAAATTLAAAGAGTEVRCDSAMRSGMFVRDGAAFPPESVYSAVPNDVVMSRAAARTALPLGAVLRDLDARFADGDEYHELLLHLVLEGRRGAASFWAPYLATLPSLDTAAPTLPLLYEFGGDTPINASSADAALSAALAGATALPDILAYRSRVRRTYSAVARHVFTPYAPVFGSRGIPYPEYACTLIGQGHSRTRTNTTTHNAHALTHAGATHIMDTRVIWWDGARHLVPMLDAVNCAAGVTAGRVHATVAGGGAALTRADRAYGSGDQVWEDYGQRNVIYYTFHGFTLRDNAYDCVDVRLADDDAMEAAPPAVLQGLKDLEPAVEAGGGARAVLSRSVLGLVACIPTPPTPAGAVARAAALRIATDAIALVTNASAPEAARLIATAVEGQAAALAAGSVAARAAAAGCAACNPAPDRTGTDDLLPPPSPRVCARACSQLAYLGGEAAGLRTVAAGVVTPAK